MSKKFGFSSGIVLLGAIALVAVTRTPAGAIPPFMAEFKAKYVKADSTDAKEAAFAKAVDAAKCAVCHAAPARRSATTTASRSRNS